MWQTVVAEGGSFLGRLFGSVSSRIASVSSVVEETAATLTDVGSTAIKEGPMSGLNLLQKRVQASWQRMERGAANKTVLKLLRNMYYTGSRSSTRVKRGPVLMYLGRKPNKQDLFSNPTEGSFVLRRRNEFSTYVRPAESIYPPLTTEKDINAILDDLMFTTIVQGSGYNRRLDEVVNRVERHYGSIVSSKWHKRGSLGGLPIEGEPIIEIPIDIALRIPKIKTLNKSRYMRTVTNLLMRT